MTTINTDNYHLASFIELPLDEAISDALAGIFSYLDRKIYPTFQR